MYRAKTAGGRGIRFFDPEMQAAITERTALAAQLSTGIQQQQFLLYYQPQVDQAGILTGAEALLRWQHPEHGLVLPDRFIPLAEETGLILRLGQWVLETACAQLVRWSRQRETAHLSLAVNVSASQFHQADFVTQVLGTLERSGADPRKLKLELTESMLLADIDDACAKMTEMKKRGLRFALDDFGTGYSSLSYLKSLPLSELKIDKTFVADVQSDPNAAAIAKTIVFLAQSLGLSVIAEGVETEPQRAFLDDSGCRDFQGYLFSRPLPVETFEIFLSQTSHRLI
jgi:EAL domain-containing protein (putative c-di-GMP-specific phosphodiesterase class I)